MSREKKSYCCPNGGFLAFPAAAAGLATFLTWSAATSCNFFHIETTVDLSGALGMDTIVQKNQTATDPSDIVVIERGVGIGFWSIEHVADGVQGNYGCESYPASLMVDGALRFARVMAVTGTTMSILVLVMILIPSCVNFDNCPFFRYLAGSFFALAIITMLFLVSMASEICQDATTCHISTSGVSIIFTSFIWLLTGGLTLYMNNPQHRPPLVMAAAAASSSSPFTVTTTNGPPPREDLPLP